MKKRVISILLSLCLFAGFVPSMQLDLNTEAKTEAMTEDVESQYLSDLEWSSQSCGASQDFPGGTVKDASINGGAMVLLVEGKETSFNKGLGAHAPSEIVYDISDMGCTKFEAYAGVDYQCFRDYQNGEAIVGNFIVEIDGVQVAQSGEMNPAMDAYHFVVDVPEGGPTFDPVTVNALTLQVVEGEICFYLEDVLVAKSASLGKMSVNGSVVSDFVIAVHEVQENVTTERGCATRLVLEMSSTKANLTKTVWYDLLTDIEGAVVTTTFVTSAADIKLTEIVENEFALADPDPNKIWSYNGGGEGSQSFYDTLQKVNNSFSRENKQDETAAGDWELNPEKFPNGAADMKRLTDTIHEKGMTIVLWWRPMDGGRDCAFSVISGHTQQPSNLLKNHPEYFVKNADGSFAKLSGPGSSNSYNGSTGYALCPYSEGAVESQVDFVKRAMTEWGIDGFKSDYVWGMPKCYNEAHNHVRPEESTEDASEIFYKAIYEEMIMINPDAFHLLCNCGTPQDYYSLPYVTQIPTADPTSVDQTRRRVKAYKALAGDDFPITTDHNEIWYPSSVGTGAVLIEKDGMMYYSFYRDGAKYRPTGNPEVVLKGLEPDTAYKVEDYVNGTVIAENVLGSEAVFEQSFSNYLLLRAIPIEKEEVRKEVCEVFPDISHGDWYEEAVQYVYDNKIMNGTNGLFKPKGNITRAQVIATLYNLEGSPKAEGFTAVEVLKDVYQGQWYTDAICWAYETGVAKGSSPTRFGVDDLITRQQLATMLFNYAKYKGYDTQTRGDYSALKGADEVADYAVETMKWAVGKGFINGSKTTIAGTTVYDLNPAGTATRAQMASVLMKSCEENHL